MNLPDKIEYLDRTAPNACEAINQLIDYLKEQENAKKAVLIDNAETFNNFMGEQK